MLKLLKIGPLLVVVLVALMVVLYNTGELPLPYKFIIMRSGSMTPTIPERSVVIVREHQYRVGQVVSFMEDGELVTHRLVAINPNGTITTKGDANQTVDAWQPPVPKRNIIGGVVATQPVVGFYLKALDTIPGLICLVDVAWFWWLWWSYFEESKRKHVVPRLSTA